MSYVPPALRRKQETAASKGEDRTQESASSERIRESTAHPRSLKDIQKHFWPNWVPEIPISAPKHSDGHVPDESVQLDIGRSSTDGTRDVSSIKSREEVSLNSKSSPILEKNAEPKTEHTISPGRSTSEIETLGSVIAESSHQTPSVKPSERDRANTTGLVPMFAKYEGRPGRERGAYSGDLSNLELVHPHNTLNNTEEAQDSLQYVLLFHDANPRWPKDKIIYVKSALELLPAPKTDHKGSLAEHIMIFEQQNSQRTASNAMFSFIGYFNLVNMQILEPQTPELVRMQEQKWTRMDRNGRPRPINRNAESWKKSLTQRWAVLRFENDDEATKELQAPQIEASSTRLDTPGDSRQEPRSVNEMLKEMRLKDDAQGHYVDTNISTATSTRLVGHKDPDLRTLV